MRARKSTLLMLGVMALTVTGCGGAGAGPPVYEVTDLQGGFSTPGCPPMRIEGSTIIAAEHRVTFEIARTRRGERDVDILTLPKRLAYNMTNGCRWVLLNEPGTVLLGGSRDNPQFAVDSDLHAERLWWRRDGDRDPAATPVEQTDGMRRRMERLANMSEAEREYMIRHPDQMRATDNQACAPGNPC